MQHCELVLEPVVALRGRRERKPERPVLVLVPAGAEPDVDAPSAHVVDLGSDHRERADPAERDRRDQRAQADAGRVARQTGERRPGVGHRGQRPRRPHLEVVVGAEERAVAVLGADAGHGQELVVGRALLGLGEEACSHVPEVT